MLQRGAESMQHAGPGMAASAAGDYAPFSRIAAGSSGAGSSGGSSAGSGNGSRWMPSGASRMFGGMRC